MVTSELKLYGNERQNDTLRSYPKLIFLSSFCMCSLSLSLSFLSLSLSLNVGSLTRTYSSIVHVFFSYISSLLVHFQISNTLHTLASWTIRVQSNSVCSSVWRLIFGTQYSASSKWRPKGDLPLSYSIAKYIHGFFLSMTAVNTYSQNRFGSKKGRTHTKQLHPDVEAKNLHTKQIDNTNDHLCTCTIQSECFIYY